MAILPCLRNRTSNHRDPTERRHSLLCRQEWAARRVVTDQWSHHHLHLSLLPTTVCRDTIRHLHCPLKCSQLPPKHTLLLALMFPGHRITLPQRLPATIKDLRRPPCLRLTLDASPASLPSNNNSKRNIQGRRRYSSNSSSLGSINSLHKPFLLSRSRSRLHRPT